MPHITQIAAMEIRSRDKFGVYSKPLLPISAEAQRVTGIYMDDRGGMIVNGEKVDCYPIHSAIKQLCNWLKKYSNVFLVAHNGRRIDFPVLMTTLQNTNTTDMFFECVSGFIDSIPVFKTKFLGPPMKQEDWYIVI